MHRSAIYQLYHYAHTSTLPIPFPHIPIPLEIKSQISSHPLRPAKPLAPTLLYSRHISHLSSHFKLSVCGLGDLNTLHGWLNDDRVDRFWQEKGTWEAHESFLLERTADPHVIPVIGSYVTEGDKAGDRMEECESKEERAIYAEIYWVKEDRLGQYLGAERVEDYDRGLHMLVGSSSLRGPHRVRAWLPSLVHYAFLDDPRTNRVLCEPNEQNEKMVGYLESVGFVREGSVVFPHKTAALMFCEREQFYRLCPF